jgi:hypothetical protein
MNIYSLVLLLVMLTQNTYGSEIYQYTNEKGRKIFVNRLSQVPAKYRSQLKTRANISDANTEQQQAVYDQENEIYAQRIALRSEMSKLKRFKASISTPVVITGNQVIVPVSFEYKGRQKKLQLLLDTGASMTVLHAQSVGNFDPKGLKSSLAQVAGGALVKTWGLFLDDFSFGHYRYNTKQVMVMEHEGESNIDGLLGMDVISITDYKIDFLKQRILWDEKEMSRIEKRIGVVSLELDALK